MIKTIAASSNRIPTPEPLNPAPVHGRKAQLASCFGDESDWRALKNQLKPVALASQWKAMLENDQEPGRSVTTAMTSHLAALPSPPRLVNAQATFYIRRKAKQAEAMICKSKGVTTGAKFPARGTTFSRPVFRTREGTPFFWVDELDAHQVQAIERQTGVPNFTRASLGQGSDHEVRVVQTLSKEGRRDRLLAGRKPVDPEDGTGKLRDEIDLMSRLPLDDRFPQVRESYVSASTVIALEELAAGGHVETVKFFLRASEDLDAAAKETLWLSVAKWCIEAVARLHLVEPPIRHGDIRGSNYLVVPQSGGPTRIVLSDFGMSTQPRAGQEAAALELKDRRALADLIEQCDWRPGSRCDGPDAGSAVTHPDWPAMLEALRNPDVPLGDVLDRSCLQSVLPADELKARLALVDPRQGGRWGGLRSRTETG